MRISKEALPYGIVLSILTVFGLFFSYIIFFISLILLTFILFFFRNPHRKIVINDLNILSPADGKVLNIVEFNEQSYIKGEAVKISIFLSIFNVHINRTPIAGIITYNSYRPGKYLPAFKSHASELNERNTIGIENSKTKILVHQITGFIARRIMCFKKKGDSVLQGEIYGLIKFGSCTEVDLPDNVKVMVKVGDTVRAGVTVLGVIEDKI